MNHWLTDGLTIALIGMSVVFIFLVLLVFSIKALAFFLTNATANELAEFELAQKAERLKIEQANNKLDDNALIAVISAAISTYRRRHK